MKMNRRKAAAVALLGILLFLLVVTAAGMVVSEQALYTDFSQKDLAPGWNNPFGTDWMGRDMFVRSLCGMSMSIRIGLVTATVSAFVALLLGSLAALMGKAVDVCISCLIDMAMGIPHMLLLILISFAAGKGLAGIVAGVTVTHWMSLARVIRGEILQLKESGYVKVARQLGKSRWHVACKHIAPHLLPQFMVGLVLLFPHAILHEASITFLGFGLPPEQPAIGVILSESMRYLSMGSWWLALFPGALLMGTVCLFDLAGNCLRQLVSPGTAHQ